MEPSSLVDLEALVRVAELGTLARAARSLGLSPSALSRRLSRLEARLGVALALRTTRSLALTEEGRILVARSTALLAGLREAEEEIGQRRERPSGTLVVAASAYFGQHVVAPTLARFVDENPDVRVKLLLEDRFVDLVRERVDLAVRLGSSLSASTLVARRIGVQERWLCAAPALLSRTSTPRTVADLVAHRLLDLTHAPDRGRWAIVTPDGPRRISVSPQVESSSLAAVHAMAVAGAGIAALPTHVARGDVRLGRLVRVMPDHTLASRAIWLVRARGRTVTAAMARFSSLLEPIIREGG